MQYVSSMENEDRIISNLDVLTEDYLPPNIPGREPQIKELAHCLRPTLRGKQPIHVWLYGKPGAGKTTAARYVLDQLLDQSHVKGVYVNCWETNTFYSVMDKLITELRMLRAEKLSSAFKLQRLEEHLKDHPFVVALDEIDQPSPKERNTTIYNLCSMGNTGLICICNSRYFLFAMEDRIKSRLNARQIEFPPYSVQDLIYILTQRAKLAFVPGTWTPLILEQIAELAEGDARVAIQTVRNAAQFAEDSGSKVIGKEDVKKGWNSAKDLKRTYLLRKLTEHHKLLYQIVRDRKQILSGQLWLTYLKECRQLHRKPIAPRTFFAYMNKLCELDVITAERARVRGNVRLFRAEFYR